MIISFICDVRWFPPRRCRAQQCSGTAKINSSSQVRPCHGRNSLNVILDISTDCVSQWDSYRWLTVSRGGKCLLLVCSRQGLNCQFSESELWLQPLWLHPPARSCAGQRMHTRIKKTTWRGDAIAGNIKLFAWAGFWIIIFRQKKIRSTFGNVEWQVQPSTAEKGCVALLLLNPRIIFWTIFDF
jgi:hypothetical protein